MIFLIFIHYALELVSADHSYSSRFPQYAPLFDGNGLPIDTAEVQAARGSHLASHAAIVHQQFLIRKQAEAKGYHGGSYGDNIDNTPNVHVGSDQYEAPWATQSVNSPPSTKVYHTQYANQNSFISQPLQADGYSYNNLRLTSNNLAYGSPHNVALAQHTLGANVKNYWQERHQATIGHDGQPIETPEVQAAKSHHLSVHAQESIRNNLGKGAVLDNHLHQSSIQDTPAVQLAKVQHQNAHAKAVQQNLWITEPEYH